MQTEKKRAQFPFVSPGIQQSREATNNHFAFITDDCGIHTAFELIKFKLRNECDSFLSLIYSVNGPFSHPLFVAELESLGRRYYSQLITYYEYSGGMENPGNSDINQQLLEIIINSNTCEKLQFLVLGQEDLVIRVTGRLLFLGIQPNQIHSQIL
jgi:hypothetical protein